MQATVSVMMPGDDSVWLIEATFKAHKFRSGRRGHIDNWEPDEPAHAEIDSVRILEIDEEPIDPTQQEALTARFWRDHDASASLSDQMQEECLAEASDYEDFCREQQADRMRDAQWDRD